MSQAVVRCQRAALEHAYSLIAQFIEVCPEPIWAQSFGGWPVWQQVYHALGGLQSMTLREGESPDPGLYPPEAGMFELIPDKVPTRKDMFAYAARMKAKADAYINALRDVDLPDPNVGLTARMKARGVERAFSHAQTLSMLAGHLLYHLGACDAALRQQGLKGVF